MYVCKGCGREQNDKQFYSHPQKASGHLSFCKDCIVAKAKAHRAANSIAFAPMTGGVESCRIERRR